MRRLFATSCALAWAFTLPLVHGAEVTLPQAATAPLSGPVSETAATGSSMPVVSADGRYVAFISRAQNLVTNATSGSYQIFLRNLMTSNIVLVSASPSNIGGNNHSVMPSLSSNGLWIAFESEASDLVPDDTNHVADILVRDVAGGQTIRV